MKKSKNFDLALPEGSDKVRRADIVGNFEKIDEALSLAGTTIVIASTLPDIANRKNNTLYFRVTNIDNINESIGQITNLLADTSGDQINSTDNEPINTNI